MTIPFHFNILLRFLINTPLTNKDIWGSFWKKEPVFVIDNENTHLEEVKELIEDKRSIYPVELNRVFESIFSPRVFIKRGRQDISKDYPIINEQTTQEAFERAELKRQKAEIVELLEKDVPDRVDNKLPVPNKDYNALENIKKEYSSYFDEDSGNNTSKEGLEDVKGYLDDELSVLSNNTPASRRMSKALEEIHESSNKRLKPEVVTESLVSKEVESKTLPSKGKEVETLPSKGKEVECESLPSKGKGKEIESETKPNDGPSDTPTSGPSGTPTIGPSDIPSDGPSDTSSNPTSSFSNVAGKSLGEEKLSDEFLIDPWANFPLPGSLPPEEIAGNSLDSLIDILVNTFFKC